MSIYVYYSELTPEQHRFTPKARKWQKSADFIAVWLEKAMNVWHNRIKPDASNRWGLDQVHPDLKKFVGRQSGKLIKV